jgi:uncharacterized membrane protein YgcG
MLKENAFHRFSFSLWFALFLLVWSALPAWCADLALLWDANSEPDIKGYGIYFKNTPDSEYILYGYMESQEFADPGRPRMVVSGLEKGKSYYFAATAYDTEGLESGFSNSICVEVGDTIAACSTSNEGSGEESGSIVDGSSSGGGGSSGSGGGGGCFIDSLF